MQRKAARDTKVRELRAKVRTERLAKNKQRRAQWLKSAETYDKEYTAAQKALVDNLRKARAEGGFYVPAESKLIVVTRIRGYCLSP